MASSKKTFITIETTVNAHIENIWEAWTEPKHIIKWNAASDDWHTTKAQNDLKKGGKFSSRMEAKDGSFGFDFGGTYDDVQLHEYIEYTLEDDRKVKIWFTVKGTKTYIKETFEAEGTNPVEMQKNGWQAILNNFKKYVENSF